MVYQQIRWRFNSRSHGCGYACPTVRQLCDLSGEDEPRDWSGKLILTHDYVSNTTIPVFLLRSVLLIYVVFNSFRHQYPRLRMHFLVLPGS